MRVDALQENIEHEEERLKLKREQETAPVKVAVTRTMR
jgi:hypothetical protein